ncbi:MULTISPECIES: Uma2 family endonuclease [Deinococcus]|uniref:Uma2 family endonuclease n=1 Tax=Deinococcus rufus TaxID=2136097 RepID=A0ABV7ZDU1_9DEIO|nr:Uma2 family endonuclease [Deinococcus sp. AB2017081]WQE96809.1 Uma2 family endonuclease [Deinococcus sp. AB2017081]
MTESAFRTMTEEEYLRWNGPRDGKWEFVDGFVYAQAGASRPHNRISTNIQRVFLPATDNGSCWTHVSDLKVRVYRDSRPRYYLPDIVVVCDPDSTGDVETAPCLIVEILSASTRAVDESFKASDYRRLGSLQGYLLVDSEARGVEFHRRVGDDWQIEVVEESVDLPCLSVTLRVDDIYRGVEV